MPDHDDETDSERGVPASDALVDWLCDQLSESLNSVAGHPVRVDAGEAGQIWLAVRDAADDPDAEHGLMQALEARLDALHDDAPDAFELEVSTGRMEEDLILRCRVLEPTSGSE